MKRNFEILISVLGVAAILGWFVYRAQNPLAPPETEMQTQEFPVEVQASPISDGTAIGGASEQPKLSSSQDLAEIESDVNATVIYDEDLSDLK